MIYFDNAATTKPSASAINKASIFNNELFYNPSALYQQGIDNSNEIKKSKDKLLKFLGVSSSDFEIIFTSCGTESDNQAIFSCVKRGTFVTSKGEHSAVHKSFLELKNRGYNVEFIDLKDDGSVDTFKLYDFVKKNKVDFVSLVHVNNETGAINDVNLIAQNLKKINPKLIFHSDGVQAFGKLKYRLSPYVDFYSISAHKINGLKGTGALIKKRKINLSPYIIGGGQENGFRSGTENIFGIKVLEYASEDRFNCLNENNERIDKIREYIKENLDKELFSILRVDNYSPYILNVSAIGLKGEVVMHTLENYGVIVGNGSACSSKNKYSRVMQSCNVNDDYLEGVIRLSFSPENTIDEAVFVTEKLNEIAKNLKGIMK